MEIKNPQKGIAFPKKDLQKENRELISKYDQRINDLLHTIEFSDVSPSQAYKLVMKLQGFLKKRRALKVSGRVYVPRTETGNYIVDGVVTKRKKGEEKKE